MLTIDPEPELAERVEGRAPGSRPEVGSLESEAILGTLKKPSPALRMMASVERALYFRLNHPQLASGINPMPVPVTTTVTINMLRTTRKIMIVGILRGRA